MKNLVLSIRTVFTHKRLMLSFLVYTCVLAVYPQAVYVDSENGDDGNPGTEAAPFYSIHKALETVKSNANSIYTVKINSGVYILDSVISISTDKDMTGRRIVFEANTLPDDPSWTPEGMPLIISNSRKGEIPGYDPFVVGFLINESHITIRGLKFPGYFYPNAYYFPIARVNKATTDLLVEQCMFVGDDDASRIQVGVIAHGDSVRVDHCVFHNANNGIVFWEDTGGGTKTGNSLTNSIIIGGFSAIWTSVTDEDFSFKKNIVSGCEYAWVKNHYNTTVYTLDTCVIVNNQNYQGVWHPAGVGPEAFTVIENDVIKEGEISLSSIDNIDNPIPIDYLHILPDSLGYNLNAGLFKGVAGLNEKVNSKELKLFQNFPNPYDSSIIIKYNLPNSNHVTLKIYNVAGQKLATPVDEFQTAGKHEVEWEPNKSASGTYFCRLQAGNLSDTIKLVLQKMPDRD